MAGSEREMERAANEIAARLRALIGQPQVSEAYIRFRLDLLAAQQATREAVVETVAAASPLGALPDGSAPGGCG